MSHFMGSIFLYEPQINAATFYLFCTYEPSSLKLLYEELEIFQFSANKTLGHQNY